MIKLFHYATASVPITGFSAEAKHCGSRGATWWSWRRGCEQEVGVCMQTGPAGSSQGSRYSSKFTDVSRAEQQVTRQMIRMAEG